jgi:hypothetical protein
MSFAQLWLHDFVQHLRIIWHPKCQARPFVVDEHPFSGGLIMSRPHRNLVIASLLGLSFVAWESPAAKGGDGGSAGVQSSTPAPAAPSAAAPIGKAAANANSGTYRAFSTDPGAHWVYYYHPGYGGCYYYYAPASSPAATGGQSAPNVTAPSVTAANPNSVTYRSYSADPVVSPTYSYSNPGVYNYSSSNYSYSSGGHTWGSRR